MPIDNAVLQPQTKNIISSLISRLQNQLEQSRNDLLLEPTPLIDSSKKSVINDIIRAREREAVYLNSESEREAYTLRLLALNEVLQLFTESEQSLLGVKQDISLTPLDKTLKRSMGTFYRIMSNVLRDELRAFNLCDLSTYELIENTIRLTAALNSDPTNKDKLDKLIALQAQMPTEFRLVKTNLIVSAIIVLVIAGAALLTPIGGALIGLALAAAMWTVLSALVLLGCQECSLKNSVEPVITNFKKMHEVRDAVKPSVSDVTMFRPDSRDANAHTEQANGIDSVQVQPA